jgi:hypothetical protein
VVGRPLAQRGLRHLDGEAGGWSAYQKGSAILTMIESWIGEATMQKAIRGYVDASAGRSITSKALFSALDTAAAKPVSKVAASFLDQPGVPLVKVSLSCGAKPNDPAKARLEVSDVSGGGRSWVLPACLRVVGSASPACTLIEGTSATIELPTCAAVHPNFEEAGYYRYELDEAATQRLLASYRKLDERERAGFVLNAWALVLLGRAPPDSVMAALKLGADKAETSRVVLEAVITVLYELERTFATDDNAAKLAAFVRGLLGPHRERVAMPKAGEHDTVRIHRVALLAALYDLGADANVAKALEPIAAQYLASPAERRPRPGPARRAGVLARWRRRQGEARRRPPRRGRHRGRARRPGRGPRVTRRCGGAQGDPRPLLEGRDPGGRLAPPARRCAPLSRRARGLLGLHPRGLRRDERAARPRRSAALHDRGVLRRSRAR